MKVEIDRLVSVSKANSKGVSWLVAEAEAGLDTVLLKNGEPAAAVINMHRFSQLDRLERLDLAVAQLVQAWSRLLDQGDDRRSLHDVLHEFGLDDDDLISP